MTSTEPSGYPIFLPIYTAKEASAASVALVGLIHDPTLDGHDSMEWTQNASILAKRLEVLRGQMEGESE